MIRDDCGESIWLSATRCNESVSQCERTLAPTATVVSTEGSLFEEQLSRVASGDSRLGDDRRGEVLVVVKGGDRLPSRGELGAEAA